MNIAVCYLYVRPKKIFNFNHLERQIKLCKNHNIDLYKYEHNENSKYNITNNVCTFNYKYICENNFNYTHIFYNNGSKIGKFSGRQIFVLLDLFLRCNKKKYDLYCFIEDDILINTNRNIFDNIDGSSDVILQNPRMFDDKWYWYKDKSLHNIDKIFLPMTGLLNIYFIKPDILKLFISNVIDKNYYGHHELLFNGFIESIKDNIKISYLSDIFKCCLKLCEYEVDLHTKYEIIHPVKTVNSYIKLYNCKKYT